MINVKNLSFGYNEKRILNELSVTVKSGELCALIGPSGSGKTTFIKILAGIIKKYTGNIEYISARENAGDFSIGYVPQNYGLLPWKTVGENIAVPLKLKGEKQDIIPITETLEIDLLLNRYPAELSGGQKQRVALARALLSTKDLLLMDEPFSALDMFTSKKAQELFLNIWAEHRVTSIFVTHNAHEAIDLAQRILIMNKTGNISEYTDLNEKDKLFGLLYNI